MNPPGIMLYFEVLPALEWLSDAEKGQLFSAILEYGRNGVVPNFDGTLAALWALIAPRIDRDAEAYCSKVHKAKYATYCRNCKTNGTPKMSLEDWLANNLAP